MTEVLAIGNNQEILLSYQKAWIADKSQLKIAEKSRRTGITWAEAADAVLTAAASRQAGGSDHFYVGASKDMAVEFIDACAMWARAFDKAGVEIQEAVLNDQDKDILTYTINFASGFKIQALSSRPSNLRGRQGSVTIDEAAFHDHLDEVLKAALALTMWGAKVRLISTHNGVDNPFNELIEDSRAGKKDYSVHRITLDDACEAGLYQRICLRKGETWSPQAEEAWKAGLLKNTASKEDALEEYYCVPKQSGGSYLSRALIEARMVAAPVLRYTGNDAFNSWPEHLRHEEIQAWCEAHLKPLLEALNPALNHSFGEDFARTGDLTVMSVFATQQDLRRVCPLQVELKNMPFRQQEQILNYICDGLPRLTGLALDARGNGQYLAEQARYRYGAGRVEEVMLSQSWYLENMPKFKAAFEDDLIRIPRDKDILDDLRAIQVVKGIPKLTDVRTGDKKERHGDAAIALALGYYASLTEFVDIDFTPLPDKTGRWDGPTHEDDDDFTDEMAGGW